jgi:hypothetical protein
MHTAVLWPTWPTVRADALSLSPSPSSDALTLQGTLIMVRSGVLVSARSLTELSANLKAPPSKAGSNFPAQGPSHIISCGSLSPWAMVIITLSGISRLAQEFQWSVYFRLNPLSRCRPRIQGAAATALGFRAGLASTGIILAFPTKNGP